MGVKGSRLNKPKTNIKRKYDSTLHYEYIQIVSKWLKKHTYNVKIHNCPIIATDIVSLNNTGEVPDVIGWSSSQSVLVEVKTSRTDFKKDFKKKFRIDQSKGMGNYRLYCCPENMIDVNELPENWGLLYVVDNKIKLIKFPEYQNANLDTERSLLLSIIRRLK